MPTPVIDLKALSPLMEIVLRAGDVSIAGARGSLQTAYAKRDPAYPDAVGLSVLFRRGATLDELAREGLFPHRKLSFSLIGPLLQALAIVGYEPILYVTPTPDLPDHHSLAVGRNRVPDHILADAAADALIRASTVVDNPYRQPNP
jgi:hypothetical protein